MPQAPAPPFLTAEWRDLIMLNYEIDPAILKSRVPSGCELDFHQDRTFVSVVGFKFFNTRVLGLSIPGHRNFEEVNLRFYVRRKVDGSWRRGVVFVKELVPRWAIAFVARTLYGENYVSLPMRRRGGTDAAPEPCRLCYRWKIGSVWEGMEVRLSGEPQLAPDSSEETFITEHYWGYSAQKNGSTVEYQVEHPRWKVWQAESATFQADVARLYGADMVEPLSAEPSSAFIADGSEIIVRKGVRLD